MRVPDEQPLWRYQDLHKFELLIQMSSLYFCRIDHLRRIDPLEGYIAPLNIRRAEEADSDCQKRLRLQFVQGIAPTHTFANCWHANELESRRMWEAFVPGSEGVAIQSTAGRLRSLFHGTNPLKLAMVDRIRYINLEDESMEDSGDFFPVLYKTEMYRHEREVRIWMAYTTFYLDKQGLDILNPGESVRIDLEGLVEQVVIHPDAHPGLDESVHRVLAKHGQTIPVRPSSLCRRN